MFFYILLLHENLGHLYKNFEKCEKPNFLNKIEFIPEFSKLFLKIITYDNSSSSDIICRSQSEVQCVMCTEFRSEWIRIF